MQQRSLPIDDSLSRIKDLITELNGCIWEYIYNNHWSIYKKSHPLKDIDYAIDLIIREEDSVNNSYLRTLGWYVKKCAGKAPNYERVSDIIPLFWLLSSLNKELDEMNSALNLLLHTATNDDETFQVNKKRFIRKAGYLAVSVKKCSKHLKVKTETSDQVPYSEKHKGNNNFDFQYETKSGRKIKFKQKGYLGRNGGSSLAEIIIRDILTNSEINLSELKDDFNLGLDNTIDEIELTRDKVIQQIKERNERQLQKSIKYKAKLRSKKAELAHKEKKIKLTERERNAAIRDTSKLFSKVAKRDAVIETLVIENELLKIDGSIPHITRRK
jgi:hypothetical protein